MVMENWPWLLILMALVLVWLGPGRLGAATAGLQRAWSVIRRTVGWAPDDAERQEPAHQRSRGPQE